MFESLELRRHFSISASVTSGTLNVWGDNNANGISVDSFNAKFRVRQYVEGVGYQTVSQFSRGGVQRIVMYGYAGLDTLTINDNVSRRATIMGGSGADYLKGGGGHSDLYGHGALQTDPAGAHNGGSDDSAADTLVTGKGATDMFGQKGNDQFFFNQAHELGVNDLAYGSFGNDVFNFSGARGVTAIGDAGNDTFMIGAQNGFVQIYGNDGSDTVDYINFPFAVYATNDAIQYSGPRFSAFDGERQHIIYPDIETIKGTNLRDSLQNHNPVGNLFGRGERDNLYGQGGRNVIDGGAGDDFLYGGGNHDTIFGGDGNDKIEGDSGNDIIKGDAGKDTLLGESGNDRLHGGSQDDLLEGGSGNDTLYGEGGGDHLYGDSGANLLVGGSGSDYLYARNGTILDIIIGDDTDGGGSANAFDIAVVDLIVQQGQPLKDAFIGVEYWSV